MLTMTPAALSVVRKVTAHPRLGRDSGLRISGDGGAPGPLQVRAATAPQAEDQVVERDGARVFLGREAVPCVKDRLLDAVTEGTGRVHFVLKAE